MTQAAIPVGHLLLLAGSGEARDIAQALSDPGQMRVTASLHFAPRSFGALPITTRTGPFGGDAGFVRFLAAQGITAVLDATHPFAAQISARTLRICTDLGLPHAQVLRPGWQAVAGDNWQYVDTVSAAAALLQHGQHVFTTTGQATLPDLINSPAQFFVRQLEPRTGAISAANVRYITGKGPFSVADEMRTLRDLGIDTLVAKNSGGLPSRTKLDAARALGIKVILIRRPPLLNALRLETVSQALNWIKTL